MTNRSLRSLKARSSGTVIGMARASFDESARRVATSVPVPAEEAMSHPLATMSTARGRARSAGSMEDRSPLLLLRGPFTTRGGGMRKYEILLILPADAEEATVTATTDRIAQVIGSGDGRVTNVDGWGRRRLAYEIDRRGEGFYVVVDCVADPTVMREVER